MLLLRPPCSWLLFDAFRSCWWSTLPGFFWWYNEIFLHMGSFIAQQLFNHWILTERPGCILTTPRGFPTRCAWSIHLMHLSLGLLMFTLGCLLSPLFIVVSTWFLPYPLDLLLDRQKWLKAMQKIQSLSIAGVEVDPDREYLMLWSNGWPGGPGLGVVKTSEVGWPFLKKGMH